MNTKSVVRDDAGSPSPDQESSLSTMALLSALEDSHSAILIFDRQMHLIHVTTQLWEVLQVRSQEPLNAPEVLDLLSRSSLDESSMAAAKNRIAEFHYTPNAEPVVLHNTDASRTVRMRLCDVGEGGCAAYFEQDSRESIQPREPFDPDDSLTSLASRRSFGKALDAALIRTPAVPVAVLLIDLDRFKTVNDTLGHAAGDTVLLRFAERLKVAVRASDLVARFGGDEFAVLIDPAPDRDAPTATAQRIIDLARRTFLVSGQLVNVGASIGIALTPSDGMDSATLLRSADLALYEAKTSGRGTLRYFDVDMQLRAQARRVNELELRRALALRQLEVFYQPQVNTSENRLVGFEALLRWRHPERGLVPPGEFLPLAEEIGIMVPIGEWVLRTACKEALKWPSEVVLAVNASPLEIEAGHFAESVRRALKSTGLPGERLEIEITEGTLLQSSDEILDALFDLRSIGVHIAMDDFGTGYASLSQFARFPFDKIKIDRSLAGFEGNDLKKRAIIRAITALGDNLGIAILAEGVENDEQMSRLQMDGCGAVQGYLFGKAVPADELDDVIARLRDPKQKSEEQHV